MRTSPNRKVQFPLLYPPEQSASPVIGELPNPLVPPFPLAIQQGKAAKTQTPREAEYLAAIEVFY